MISKTTATIKNLLNLVLIEVSPITHRNVLSKEYAKQSELKRYM